MDGPPIDQWIAMPAREYHAGKGWNSSKLKTVKRSVAHSMVPTVATPPMERGSAFHPSVLEGPDGFARDVFVLPKSITRRYGKAYKEAMVEAGGRIILTYEEAEHIRCATDSVWSHPAARDLLEWSDIEQSRWYHDERTGLLCKARADMLSGPTICDLKSTQDASEEGFSKSCANFKYHVQAAHYLAADPDRSDFTFVAVELTPPLYAVAVWSLSASAVALGHEIRRRALDTIAAFEASMSDQEFNPLAGVYGDDVRPLDLPKWAYRQEL